MERPVYVEAATCFIKLEAAAVIITVCTGFISPACGWVMAAA